MKGYVTTKNWVSLLRGLPSPEGDFLTITSLARLTGLKESALRQACWRNQRAGLVHRVGPGLYANLLKSPRGEHLAVILFPPAYLSLDWALSYHGLTQQAIPTLTCVTTGRPRKRQTFLGAITYGHISSRLFFGFEKTRLPSGAYTILAYPEKALLDWIYFRQLRRQSLPWDEMDLSGLNWARLQRFADRFPLAVQRTIKEARRTSSAVLGHPKPGSRLEDFRGILRGMTPTGIREKQERG